MVANRTEWPYKVNTITDPDGGEDTTVNLSTLKISLVQTPNPGSMR